MVWGSAAEQVKGIKKRARVVPAVSGTREFSACYYSCCSKYVREF